MMAENVKKLDWNLIFNSHNITDLQALLDLVDKPLDGVNSEGQYQMGTDVYIDASVVKKAFIRELISGMFGEEAVPHQDEIIQKLREYMNSHQVARTDAEEILISGDEVPTFVPPTDTTLPDDVVIEPDGTIVRQNR